MKKSYKIRIIKILKKQSSLEKIATFSERFKIPNKEFRGFELSRAQ